MRKFTSFLAVVGAVLLIGLVVNFVSAASARASRDTVALQQWHMEYRAIHP